ncbi:hypothetical protein Tco_0791194 [Tanacetum coccineum]
MANFPRLDELVVVANFKGLFNGMLAYFDRENGKDLEFANGLHNLRAELLERTNEMNISAGVKKDALIETIRSL